MAGDAAGGTAAAEGAGTDVTSEGVAGADAVTFAPPQPAARAPSSSATGARPRVRWAARAIGWLGIGWGSRPRTVRMASLYPRAMSSRALPASGALLLALLLAAGCSTGGGEGSAAEPTAPREVRATAEVEFVEPAEESPAPAPELEPSGRFSTSELVLRAPDGAGQAVGVYVAADGDQRGYGLMERDDLTDGTGMIFLFPRDTSGSFYMYKTRIPLSIAFIRGDGTILTVLEMEPCPSEDPAECPLYSPGGSYRQALEVEHGFFDQIGLDTSWTVELSEDLPTPS